jgi:hypothetical protein
LNLFLITSQNGLWRESKASPCNFSFNEIDEFMVMQFNGLVDRIVLRLCSVIAHGVARLGEAWKFRQTFERGRALMEEQDVWCLKAQVAASTGKLAILEDQDFPSEIELDVIIGM